MHSLKYSKECITELVFAPVPLHSDGPRFFATADAERCVSIYKWTNRDQNPSKPEEWVCLGRYRSHTKPITGLQFAPPLSDRDSVPRLLSVGEDRLLVEYNLSESSIRGGIKLLVYRRLCFFKYFLFFRTTIY